MALFALANPAGYPNRLERVRGSGVQIIPIDNLVHIFRLAAQRERVAAHRIAKSAARDMDSGGHAEIFLPVRRFRELANLAWVSAEPIRISRIFGPIKSFELSILHNIAKFYLQIT